MNEFIASYTALTTSAVTAIQKIGLLSIPLVVAITVIVNYFGGEKALRAVGMAVAIVAVLTIILTNVVGFSNWIAKPA